MIKSVKWFHTKCKIHKVYWSQKSKFILINTRSDCQSLDQNWSSITRSRSADHPILKDHISQSYLDQNHKSQPNPQPPITKITKIKPIPNTKGYYTQTWTVPKRVSHTRMPTTWWLNWAHWSCQCCWNLFLLADVEGRTQPLLGLMGWKGSSGWGSPACVEQYRSSFWYHSALQRS